MAKQELSSLGQQAVKYAEMGLKVFPLHSPIFDRTSEHVICKCSCLKGAACENIGKHPRTLHGFNDATSDPEQIKRWWVTWPKANIGIATGTASGFDVIDVDYSEDGSGEDSFAEMESEWGTLPETVTVHTGGGGTHYCVRHTDGLGSKTDLFGNNSHLDIRADGGYIVAPPSMHRSGNIYLFDLDDKRTLDGKDKFAPLPPSWEDKLRQLCAKKTAGTETSPSAVADQSEPIPEGQRNDTLYRIACSYRAKGLSGAALMGAVWGDNVSRCKPPLSQGEVQTIVSQAEKYPAGHSAEWDAAHPPKKPSTPPPAPTSSDAQNERTKSANQIPLPPLNVNTSMVGIEPMKKNFLWYPYIPEKCYSLFIASGGTGKSLFTCMMAAYITTGKAFPTSEQTAQQIPAEPRHVYFFTPEDSKQEYASRLSSAGTDMTRVNVFGRDESEGADPAENAKLEGIDIITRYDFFKSEILAHKSALAVFDPYDSFIPEFIDLSKRPQLHRVMSTFNRLASETGTSVILISHTNKKAEQDSLAFRASGSTGLVDWARSAISMITGEKDTRFLIHSKANYSQRGDTLELSIKSAGAGAYMTIDGFRPDITEETVKRATNARTNVAEYAEREAEEQRSASQEKNIIIKAAEEFAGRAKGGQYSISYDDFIEHCRDNFSADCFDDTRDISKAVKAAQSSDYFRQYGVAVKAGHSVKAGHTVKRGLLFQYGVDKN